MNVRFGFFFSICLEFFLKIPSTRLLEVVENQKNKKCRV